MKLLLKIAYDGTSFCGYQVQPNCRTVQGELNSAAKQLFGCECDITGCSRTDSGVHALSFFATVEPKDDSAPKIPPFSVIRALNSILPSDISIKDAYSVNDEFHPRYDVVSKEYVYLLSNGNTKNPFLNKKALHLPKPLTDHQIELVNEACSFLLGSHDFTSFMAEGSKITDARREIYSSSLRFVDDSHELLVFKISGNGFLYNMVRIIVGTMLDIAYGKKAPSEVESIIQSKDRTKAGQTVPAHGLYLNKVKYPDNHIV